MADGAVKSAEVEAGLEDNSVPKPGQWTIGAKAVIGIALLSCYMLLMTAAYFHTWFEKVSLSTMIVSFLTNLYPPSLLACW